MRIFLTLALLLLGAVHSPVFAECAPGFTQVPVPLCQLNSTPAPVITSPSTASCTINTSCSIQITATNTPTSWGASPLPANMSVNIGTGLISGTPTVNGTTNSTVSATNAGGTGTAPLAITVNPAVATGFYVAVNGSDSGAGTLADPFATLTKCRDAMRASGTKVCYVRAGNYTPVDPTGGNCNGDGVSCMLDLSSSDNGDTFQYYPPDGVNTAIFNGQSTADGNGMFYMIGAGNASNITINGLAMHNFQYAAIRSSGGAGAFLIENNNIFNGMATTGHVSPGLIACYGCSNWTITHNYLHDSGNWGINFANTGVMVNMVVTNNFIQNTCTGRSDCAAVYLVDCPGGGTCPTLSTGTQWDNNYVRDGNTFATLGSGFGSAFYADDCASNITAGNNVISGRNGSNTILVHGGKSVNFSDNLIDLGSLNQSTMAWQTSTCTDNSMSGNLGNHNIVVANSSGTAGGYNVLSGSPPNAPQILDSAYHQYGAGTIRTSGPNYSDGAPTSEDPQLNCWAYNIAGGSPVFNSPVSFVDFNRTWGPPGFVIPQTGTVPSSPHSC